MNKNVFNYLISICFVCALICLTSCSKRAKPVPEEIVKEESIKAPTANQKEQIQEEVDTKKKYENSPVVGMFKCKKTNDTYIFSDDGTGYFFTGGTNTEFQWSYEDDIVTLTYEAFGKEYLLFDKKKKTLKEDSETYGILVFEKV